MAIIVPNYLDVLVEYYPNVFAISIGSSEIYENLIWQSGDPLPSQAILDTARLTITKDRVWRLIQAERDRRKSSGVLVGSNWFHSDDASRIQYIGLLMYGANMPAGIMWKTMTGAFVEMTPTLAQQIFGSIAAKDTQLFTIAEQRRAIVNASTTPGTYEYLTGSPTWPAVYGE